MNVFMTRVPFRIDFVLNLVYTLSVRIWSLVMNQITVREARQHLSGLINAAERGETIVITRRGREVARLVPAEGKHVTMPDLESFRGTLKVKGKALSKMVVEARQEERF